MWCAHCQADVATEVAADGRSLLCTSCGAEIRKVYAPSLHSETRSARELLDRWSRSELLDPYAAQNPPPAIDIPTLRTPPLAAGQSPVHQQPPVSTEAPVPHLTPTLAAAAQEMTEAGEEIQLAPPVAQRPAPVPQSKSKKQPLGANLRVDSPHEHPGQLRSNSPATDQIAARLHDAHDGEERIPQPHQVSRSSTTTSEDETHSTRGPAAFRGDMPQERPRPPHFETHSSDSQAPRPAGGRQESVWGQVLAYLGVGVLTIGTVLVLKGYFGGQADLMPTGWLVCTAGQMLLFLGVVTLVSGGMQQTTAEVTRQVEYLDRRMIRIENSTHTILKGPHFAKAAEQQTRTVNENRESA